MKGIWSVNSIGCLIKDVLPRSRLLQANRCSHFSSSPLACSCSASGHSYRPWRFNTSRIHPFWGHGWTLLRSPSGGPPVVPGWQEQPCQLHWQGPLRDGHLGFSGKLVLERTPGGTPHMWQWVPWRWATGGLMLAQQTCGPTYSVPRHLCCHVYLQSQTEECFRVRTWGRGDFLPFESVWGNWSDPDITAPKWACFQVAVALTSSPWLSFPLPSL